MHPQEPSLRHTEALRVLSPEKRAKSLNQSTQLNSLTINPPSFIKTQTNALLAVSHIGKPSASGEVGSQRSDHQVIPFAKRSSANMMIAKRYSQRFDHQVIIMLANKYCQRFVHQQPILTPARHLAPREGLQHQRGRHCCG